MKWHCLGSLYAMDVILLFKSEQGTKELHEDIEGTHSLYMIRIRLLFVDGKTYRCASCYLIVSIHLAF